MRLIRSQNSLLYNSESEIKSDGSHTWLRHGTDYCASLLKRREPHGVPSPRGHRCTVCATVSLAVTPSFSDITDVSLSSSVSRPTEAAPLNSRGALIGSTL